MARGWSSSWANGAAVVIALLISLWPASPARAVTTDGVLLLSFKYSLLADPFSSLADWSYGDDTPCAWNGIVCTGFSGDRRAAVATVPRVISVILPNMQLAGPVAPELGLIEHLRHLDLSGNAINGSLPDDLFGAPELRVLSLANNDISGELPELVGELRNLRALNLAGNALSGEIPANLTQLPNLTVVSLAANYFSGPLPAGGFASVQVLDVSSNLINGTLPPDFGGPALRIANFSNNQLAGEIPAAIAARVPSNATIDLSFNNFTGPIPAAGAFLAQRPSAYAGNPGLCGRPVKNLCSIPSTLSDPPLANSSSAAPNATDSPPAFAVFPRSPSVSYPVGANDAGGAVSGGSSNAGRQGGMRLGTILAIAVGDIAGVVVLAGAFFYIYQVKKKRQGSVAAKNVVVDVAKALPPESSPESGRGIPCFFSKKYASGGPDNALETSSTSSFSPATVQCKPSEEKAVLVSMDGEPELELETLLKASAFILGAAETSIVYKAVLADGTALAVRRISAGGSTDKLKDFDAQARAVARLRHPNVLRLRGFYWGADEKLLIHDYAANGSLAGILTSRRKPGGASSPVQLNWDTRVRIARGVAAGLAYLHDKKTVHGYVKPSNILLGDDMEPMLGDVGLERLAGASFRQFGSKRSARSLPELSPATGTSPVVPSPSSSSSVRNPYQAPEVMKSPLKPNAKWDVYSFGMVLLELVAGRVMTEVEICQWSAGGGLPAEEKERVPKMADPALRGEMEGREESVLACLSLGFSCCAIAPQKRPAMRDAVQVLEKLR